MSKRKAIPLETQKQIFLKSARRCALCFGFDGDLGRKKGHIAHVDRDPSNAAEANLVYLCLEHHDEYDTKTSQSKGIMEQELLEHRSRLVEAVSQRRHVEFEATNKSQNAAGSAIRNHDERLFCETDSIMPEGLFREFIAQLQSDDSYHRSKRQVIDRFRNFFTETGNRYISDDISCKLRSLVDALDSLIAFLAVNFFWYPNQQKATQDPRLCLYPELNVDRAGSGQPEDISRYDQLQEELGSLADAATRQYEDYRSAVKSTLVR